MPYGMGYGHEKTGRKKGVDTPAGKKSYAMNMGGKSDKEISATLGNTKDFAVPKPKSTTGHVFDVWTDYIGYGTQ